MSSCCGTYVRSVLVGNRFVTVEAEPHPAGIYAVRRGGNRYFGYKIRRDETPDFGHTRHRVHIHREGD